MWLVLSLRRKPVPFAPGKIGMGTENMGKLVQLPSCPLPPWLGWCPRSLHLSQVELQPPPLFAPVALPIPGLHIFVHILLPFDCAVPMAGSCHSFISSADVSLRHLLSCPSGSAWPPPATPASSRSPSPAQASRVALSILPILCGSSDP